MDIQTRGLKEIDGLQYSEIATKIEELLPRTNKNVLLLMPDFTRGTCTVEQILYMKCKAKYGGNIDIAIANGMHRPSTLKEIGVKLGDVRESIIYQNHPFQEKEWLEKLKKSGNYYVIAFSTPYPHNHTGMGGGSKLVRPGLAHWSDVNAYHKSDPCVAVDMANEEAKKVIDFIVAASYGQSKINDIYVGKFDWNYADWVNRSCDHYRVELPDYENLPDAVILEPTVKKEDFQQSMNSMLIMKNQRIVKKGGTIFIFSYTPDGMGIHYLFQQPNGKTPVYYDELFRSELRNRELHFCMPTLCEREIHQYFYSIKPMNLDYEAMLSFIELRHGKHSRVHHYYSPDISIGE